ncbi:hypothetical protein Tel_13155 [Candidatus Tenderia electrophaga]|uniref:cyclic-guanylate-specific phosphodiesterase n=1 Tax=Candidatus Tenderia electrophaga TaxID=1748243 RepID=A0A0S2TFU6_9GAMM|nr:hypothetical protein Tel_13155 [Candidatus Tenderia electrophaga]
MSSILNKGFHPGRSPVMIAMCYVVFAGLWIYVSSFLLQLSTDDSVILSQLELVNGVFFVALSGALLYLLLKYGQGPAANADDHVQAPPGDNRPSTRRLVVMLMSLLLLVPVVGVGILAYQEPRLERDTLNNLDAIAKLKALQIESWINERQSDGYTLARDPSFVAQVVRLARGDDGPKQALRARLNAFRNAYGYRSIVLLNAQGGGLLTSGEPHRPLANQQEMLMSLPATGFQVMPLFRDAEGTLHFDLLVGLGPDGASETRPGYILIHIEPEQFLLPYMTRWPDSSPSGETLLVRDDGDSVMFLNQPKFSQANPLDLQFSTRDPHLAAAFAVRSGGSGVFQGKDYRGVPVLAAFHAVNGTRWQIIAKLDRAEVLEPLYILVRWISLISLLAVSVISISLIILWRQQQRVYGLALQAEKTKTDRALRHFYELPFIGMAITSPTTRRWLLFNDCLCEILGYEFDELAQMTWDDVTHPDDLKQNFAAFDRVVRAESDGYTLDKRFVRKDGAIVFATVDVKCVRKPDGTADYLVSTVRDITGTKLAEQALKASEARLRTLLNTIPDLIWLKDTAGVYLFCNPVFERVFGADEDEIVGKTDYDFVDKDLADFFQENDRKVILDQQPTIAEESLSFRRTGYHCVFETIKTPVFDPQGRLVGVLGIARDITDRKQAQQRLSLIIEGSNDAPWDWDLVQDELYYSPQFWRMFGYEIDELSADSGLWRRLAHADDIHAVEEAIERLTSGVQDRESVECRFRHKDGHYVPTLIRGIATCDETGKTVRLTGTLMDLSERKSIEAEMHLAAQVFEQSREGIMITDADRTIVMVNKAFTEITGYEAAEALGKTPRLVSSDRHDAAFFQAIDETLARDGYWQGEIWNKRKDDSVYPEWLSITQAVDAGGKLTGYIGVFEDITQRKQYEEHIRWLAHYDPLTRLPNRALLLDRARHAITLSERQNKKVSVLFCDLDRFKYVNDTLGHGMGDKLLAEVANRLLSVVRDGDTVSRQGGDEFVLLLPNTDAHGAARVAEKVLAAVNQAYQIDDYRLTVSFSIGIAVCPDDGREFDVLAKYADIAMYRAKHMGRNDYCFFTSDLQQTTAHALRLESDIPHAIEAGELQVYYQPQVALDGGAVIGVEALLRWKHSEFGMIPPDEFIPIAERSGQILQIGEWVLRSATRQLKTWLEMGFEPIKVAVNLSVRQLKQPHIYEKVKAILEETDLQPGLLELELTESMLMENQENVIETLYKLSELGVQIAIDDFGTGFSSLSYLKRLPVDNLKIDKTFVQDMLTNPDDAIIARSIITLGHSLGLTVIAEGVETGAQVDFLRDHNCDQLQGYVFSRPLPVDEVTRLLAGPKRMPVLPGAGIGQTAKTLLLVDDEPTVLLALERGLHSEGYRILTATSGEQGLEVLAVNQVGVIVADQRMPGMSGVEFLSKAKELYPDTIRVVLSGYTDVEFITDAINRGDIYRFFTKPWEIDVLRANINEAFRRYEMLIENRRLARDLKEANKLLARLSGGGDGRSDSSGPALGGGS